MKCSIPFLFIIIGNVLRSNHVLLFKEFIDEDVETYPTSHRRINLETPNLDFNLNIIKSNSILLDQLFKIPVHYGFFHVKLNATKLFVIDVGLCNSDHNFFGSVEKSSVCKDNARSYGFTCYNTSSTNFEKQCTFNFCLDNERFGKGTITCNQ